ncbi:MAG: glutathione S-transferase family protein [Paracoccaceae bacterium]|tara:strand:+ start:109 stop:774 length:666 start_codon:yes stop_codon:yes gene_type:complete
MFRFFHAPLSPFCRKVRLVLSEKKLEFELIEEKYWEKREDFLALNPFGQVPVLQNSEITLAESSAICEYLNEKFPDPELLPNNIEDRAEVRRLVSWFDDKFNREVTQKLVYERITKKIIGKGFPEAKNVKVGMQNIKFHIDYMSSLLEYRQWLAGNEMTLADFTAAAHFSVLDYSRDVDWDRSNLVKDWYAKIKSRPAFRSLLADHLAGFPQPPHYADLDF